MKKILCLLSILIMALMLYAEAMPEFRLPDETGKKVSLESLLGKGPLLIDFWADYCSPCKLAMPYLHELAIKYDSLTVVLVSIDAPKSQMKAKNYLKGKDYKFVTLFDAEKSLAKKLNVSNPPHTFILNKEGEIVYSHIGFEPGTEKLYEQHIRSMLGLECEAE
jgi:thiol-disulfide isomerase/thioredoxin